MRRIVIFFVALLFPFPSFAAIAYLATAHNTVSTLPQTVSVTNNGNTVVICLGEYNNPGGSYTVTGVTYGGTAMTQIGTTQSANSFIYLAAYILPNAPGGANNLVISGTTGSDGIDWAASTYSGVDTATGFDVHAQAAETNGTSPFTVSLNPAVSNEWVVVCSYDNANLVTGIYPSGSQRYYSGGELSLFAADTNGTISTGAANYGETVSGSTFTAMNAFTIKPSASGATIVPWYKRAWWW